LLVAIGEIMLGLVGAPEPRWRERPEDLGAMPDRGSKIGLAPQLPGREIGDKR
jgi:hypothetical protein